MGITAILSLILQSFLPLLLDIILSLFSGGTA